MVVADDIEKTVKEYKPYDDDGEREARHGTKIGLSEDENIDGVLSIPDSEAKKMLYEYYKSLFDNKVVIPFRLHHVVDSTTGLKPHDTYYFGVLSENRYFNIRDKDHKLVSGKIEEEEERERAADDFAQSSRGEGLKGRGLRGAGVAPLEGVVRHGRTYNFNEIQGLATPSAYVYRQLGSKYIRIPDLDAKTLVIVQPNRRKCGPKCQISDQLQAMIKMLVYKQHIDQPTYDKLSIEYKKIFKEILAITHLQYNFQDKLTDPLETLLAEYDKLKGEIELGNDNQSIIKQLKSLTVDIYGDNADNNVAELKAIMKNLIIHDRPQKTQAAVWATDLAKSIKNVDASTQSEGGRMWAYQPEKRLRL
ncbi:unnamed protein product [Phytophthora lilii]|uniref:Unnamed protein product n=1 Tax=Phytophthora lilii TaxID=2077276 RepID=A0A9W6UDH9_9STRA|nr:unnamed protein product [Phytophthora lilii]